MDEKVLIRADQVADRCGIHNCRMFCLCKLYDVRSWPIFQVDRVNCKQLVSNSDCQLRRPSNLQLLAIMPGMIIIQYLGCLSPSEDVSGSQGFRGSHERFLL